MSAMFFLTRPGEPTSETYYWNPSSGIFDWVVRFLADHVRDKEASARLRDMADDGASWFSLRVCDDDQAFEIVRIIREDLLPAAEALSAADPRDRGALFIPELVQETVRWSDRKDFWIRRVTREGEVAED